MLTTACPCAGPVVPEPHITSIAQVNTSMVDKLIAVADDRAYKLT